MTFDRTTVRIVTVSIAALALVALAGIVFLSATSHPIPDVLQNIAIGAMSALAALLASTKSEPVPVTAPEPLPVVEQDAGTRTAAVKPKRSTRSDAGHVDAGVVIVMLLIAVATVAIMGAFDLIPHG